MGDRFSFGEEIFERAEETVDEIVMISWCAEGLHPGAAKGHSIAAFGRQFSGPHPGVAQHGKADIKAVHAVASTGHLDDQTTATAGGFENGPLIAELSLTVALEDSFEEVGFLHGAVLEDDVVVEWVEVPVRFVSVFHRSGGKGVCPFPAFSLPVALTVTART